VLLNWGCSRLPLEVGPGQLVLNPPAAVSRAACKLRTFDTLSGAGVRIPSYWRRAADANRDGIVLARTTTRGSGGEGIVVVRPGEELPEAPLYTQYIRKVSEYRLHVVRDSVIMIQQKRRENGADQTADQQLIRNYGNGWIFAANDVRFTNEEQKQDCIAQSTAAVWALGLDFGAVDLVVGRNDGRAYVLEVNTAPGLQSPTLLAQYAEAFTAIKGAHRYGMVRS
jgi:glutathione synthase/RimK-type ligase-like ATP-grasp enzyme